MTPAQRNPVGSRAVSRGRRQGFQTPTFRGFQTPTFRDFRHRISDTHFSQFHHGFQRISDTHFSQFHHRQTPTFHIDRHPPFPTFHHVSGQRAPVRGPPKVAHLSHSPTPRKRRHGKRAPRKLGDFDHAVGHAVSGRFLREKWVSVFPSCPVDASGQAAAAASDPRPG